MNSSYNERSNIKSLDTEQKTILCVDDEKNIVSSLRRLFRDTDYSVITCTDPLLALDLIDKHDISVVISDYRMPAMTGLELLSKIKNKRPLIARVLLTGESDMSLVVRAINEGSIYKFISKPWNKSDLIDIVDESYNFFTSLRQKEIDNQELESSNHELSTQNRDLEEEVVNKRDELVKVSLYDTITGLANRTLIKQRLFEVIDERKATTDTLSVFAIGFDKLKRLNESSTTAIKNEVLVTMGQRLTSHARSCDIVGMLGDDRFCIILNAMIEPAVLDDIAQRIINLLAEPVLVDSKEIYLKASVGISTCPEHGTTAQDLLNRSETAVNVAKELGGGQFCHYSSEYQVIANARLSLESELRQAVKNNEFELFFQPRVCCNTEKVIAAEGLIRWIHPERGLIPPDQFIPILEDTGLINTVSRWVITEACELLQKWSNDDIPAIKLSVNLTSSLFSDPGIEDLINNIGQLYSRESVINNLELEITEGILMQDVEHTRYLLDLIREMGVSLAIDDFGTGYSSLNYLVKFPVNYLKIDKSFIDDLGINKDVNSVVRMMILLAQGLRLRVVAEGIETTKQAEALRVLGCDELQGYLYSKPLPEEQFLDFLKVNRSIVSDLASSNSHFDSQQEPITELIDA